MDTLQVDVWLYGPLARYGGEAARKAHANLQLELPAGSRVRDLLARLALPTEEAVTIALRTQQLLAHETGVPDTIDPLAGSYYVETLTNEMELEAEVTKVEAIKDIAARRIMMTPALAVNGETVSTGHLLSVHQVMKLLEEKSRA